MVEMILPSGRTKRVADIAKYDTLTATGMRDAPEDSYEAGWSGAVRIGNELYLRLHEASLTEAMLPTVRAMLRQTKVDFIRVCVDHIWRRTVVEGIAAHLIEEHLRLLLAPRFPDVWGDYLARDLHAGAVQRHSAVVAALRAWDAAEIGHDVAGWCDRFESSSSARFIVYEFDPELRDFKIVRVGRDLHDMRSGWFKNSVGRRLSSLPDDRYANRVIDDYVPSVANWRPRVQRVSAAVSWPASGTYYRDYVRVALPVAAVGRKNPLLVSVTSDYAA